MAKIKQHEEKRERNEIYALKFRKKTDEKVEKDTKKRGGKYGAWCRIEGHPSTCQCVYNTTTTVQ